MDFCGSERTLLAGKSAVEIPSANSAQNGIFDGLFLSHSACSVPNRVPSSIPFPFRRYHFVTREEPRDRTRRLYTFQARANGRAWARDACESVLNVALSVKKKRETLAHPVADAS